MQKGKELAFCQGLSKTGGGGERLSTLVKLYSGKAKIICGLHNARAAGANYYGNFGVKRFLYLETGKMGVFGQNDREFLKTPKNACSWADYIEQKSYRADIGMIVTVH